MKAGDTAYLVESNRFVHDVEILRCNAELYILCFKDNGVGLYFKTYHLLLTSYFRWRDQAFEAVGSILWGCEGECEKMMKQFSEEFQEI